MTPDVNVLVAAFRADHPHHRPALRWLQGALKSEQPLALVPLVAASFLRLVTNAKVFPDPAPITNAIAFLDALFEHPRVQWLAAQDEWSALKALCLERRLSGNALPDAWLAATVLKIGEHLVTFDTGFRNLLPRRQLTIVTV
jgi:toxin-antitoxin system PIN domain toxin